MLGHNGAGKTTTIRLLTTLARPTTGTRDRRRLRRRRRPRAGPLADRRRRTGGDRRRAALRTRQPGDDRPPLPPGGAASSRARGRAARAFGLADAAERLVKTYSGGMRRRLDLAASLVASPPVLFLDEPTTGLDPASRRELWALLDGLVRDGDDAGAHDPVPRGGRPARRPDRRPRPRPGRGRRLAGRAQVARSAASGCGDGGRARRARAAATRLAPFADERPRPRSRGASGDRAIRTGPG